MRVRLAATVPLLASPLPARTASAEPKHLEDIRVRLLERTEKHLNG